MNVKVLSALGNSMQVDQVEEKNLSSDGALNWFWAGAAPELTRVGLYCRYIVWLVLHKIYTICRCYHGCSEMLMFLAPTVQ